MKKLLVPVLLGCFSTANAAPLLTETFDPINSSHWSITGGAVEGAGNSEFFDGDALRFSGSGTRSANTIGYDFSSGGDISFRLKLGGPNDTTLFENMDGGEDVLFRYSTNSGVLWTTLFTFDTEDLLYRDTWGLASFNITGPLATANTMFQWSQIRHSGSRYDHWAIDNVSISNRASVPEPAPLALIALGLAGFRFSRKMKAA